MCIRDRSVGARVQKATGATQEAAPRARLLGLHVDHRSLHRHHGLLWRLRRLPVALLLVRHAAEKARSAAGRRKLRGCEGLNNSDVIL
eukprot:5719056-Alexandrium_andersonii.AAC.1